MGRATRRPPAHLLTTGILSYLLSKRNRRNEERAEPAPYTPEQLAILLRIAAGKLGRDPVQLQRELQAGRLDALLQSLGADREKVTALLNDKAGLSQLLQSEQVRTLLQQLLAGQAPPAP